MKSSQSSRCNFHFVVLHSFIIYSFISVVGVVVEHFVVKRLSLIYNNVFHCGYICMTVATDTKNFRSTGQTERVHWSLLESLPQLL